MTLPIDDPHNVAMFLDLDGTVLDIAAAPRDVSAPLGLSSTLGRLQRTLDGAVAILTGRKIDDVDRLLAPLKLAVAGVHGGELRFEPEGDIEVTSGSLPAPLAKAVERLVRSVPGVVVENKGIAIAVHYRAVPTMQTVLETELRDLMSVYPNRLVLSRGRKVIELMPRNATKGAALRRFMEHSRFRGRQPIMIGDDAPDETALETASRLGGLGFRVKGEHFEKRTVDFQSPTHVRRWLRNLAEQLET